MSEQSSNDYFALFDLPVSFDIDSGVLETRYRELQRAYHPDRFASATDLERRIAMQQAATVNEAFGVLKDPMRRGRYLLECAGHHFDDERSTTSDPQFLMEQMELREALGEVRASADPLQAVGALGDTIARRFGELAGQLAGQLESDPALAVQTVLKMKFFRRLAEEAHRIEGEIEDEAG